MDGFNFWLMDACVTALVLLSALYGRSVTWKCKETIQSFYAESHLLLIPDSFFSSVVRERCAEDELGVIEKEQNVEETLQKERPRGTYIIYGVLVVLYFAATTSAVILARRYPMVTVCVQHVCIFTFITVGMLYVRPGKASLCLAVLLCVAWTVSGGTGYRWLANNIIICFSVAVAAHVRFRNFYYLFIFIWVAFVYDVIILSGIHLRAGEWSFFSFDNGDCTRLICEMFSHNYNFQMPAVFTVHMAGTHGQVFIGTGDILIGAFVANFVILFFDSVRCAIFTSLAFAGAVASLSAVSLTPFPALLIIVPVCTLSILVCALFTNSLPRLLSTTSCGNDMMQHEDISTIGAVTIL